MEVQPIKTKEMRNKILLRAKNKNALHYILFITGFYSGYRISDLLKIKVKDIVSAKHLNLKQDKTSNYRKIAVHPKLRSEVKAYADKVGLTLDDFLFVKPTTKKVITERTAHRIVSGHGEALGLHLGTHSLRKTFGYILYTSNMNNIQVVQSAFGHKSERETLRYIGIEQETIDDVVLSIEV